MRWSPVQSRYFFWNHHNDMEESALCYVKMEISPNTPERWRQDVVCALHKTHAGRIILRFYLLHYLLLPLSLGNERSISHYSNWKSQFVRFYKKVDPRKCCRSHNQSHSWPVNMASRFSDLGSACSDFFWWKPRAATLEICEGRNNCAVWEFSGKLFFNCICLYLFLFWMFAFTSLMHVLDIGNHHRRWDWSPSVPSLRTSRRTTDSQEWNLDFSYFLSKSHSLSWQTKDSTWLVSLSRLDQCSGWGGEIWTHVENCWNTDLHLDPLRRA